MGVGQLGIALSFIVTAMVFCAIRAHWFLCGNLAFLSLFKPHVTFLIVPYLVWYCVYHRHWRFFGGAVAALLVLSAYPLFQNLQIYSHWMEALQNPDPMAISVKSWVVPTLVGVSRTAHRAFTSGGTTYLMAVVPTVGAAIAYCWIRSHQAKRLTLSNLALLGFLSVLFSPYGWQFDFVVLLLPMTYTIHRLLQISPVIRQLVGLTVLLIGYVGGFTLLLYSSWPNIYFFCSLVVLISVHLLVIVSSHDDDDGGLDSMLVQRSSVVAETSH